VKAFLKVGETGVSECRSAFEVLNAFYLPEVFKKFCDPTRFGIGSRNQKQQTSNLSSPWLKTQNLKRLTRYWLASKINLSRAQRFKTTRVLK
jgi:hypothetical protein